MLLITGSASSILSEDIISKEHQILYWFIEYLTSDIVCSAIQFTNDSLFHIHITIKLKILDYNEIFRKFLTLDIFSIKLNPFTYNNAAFTFKSRFWKPYSLLSVTMSDLYFNSKLIMMYSYNFVALKYARNIDFIFQYFEHISYLQKLSVYNFTGAVLISSHVCHRAFGSWRYCILCYTCILANI